MQAGLGSNRLQPPNWDKEADHLHDAMRGNDTDEVCIVKILARFTNRQRKRLLQAYTERFNEVWWIVWTEAGSLKRRKAGSEKDWKVFNFVFIWQDLTTVLESEFSGTAKEVVTALLYSPVTFDIKSLHKAFEEEDFNLIVSIIISSRNDSLMDIKDDYFAGKWNNAQLYWSQKNSLPVFPPIPTQISLQGKRLPLKRRGSLSEILKRTPSRCQDPLLWAWLEMEV